MSKKSIMFGCISIIIWGIGVYVCDFGLLAYCCGAVTVWGCVFLYNLIKKDV